MLKARWAVNVDCLMTQQKNLGFNIYLKGLWSRKNFCPHRLVRDAGELEASWRRGQPRSRQALSPSPDHESSATHDGESNGWKSLVSSHRAFEPGVPPSATWSTQLVMTVQVRVSSNIVEIVRQPPLETFSRGANLPPVNSYSRNSQYKVPHHHQEPSSHFVWTSFSKIWKLTLMVFKNWIKMKLRSVVDGNLALICCDNRWHFSFSKMAFQQTYFLKFLTE